MLRYHPATNNVLEKLLRIKVMALVTSPHLKRKKELSDLSEESAEVVPPAFKRVCHSIFSQPLEESDFIRLAKEKREVTLRSPIYEEKDHLFTNLYSGTFDDADLTEEEFDQLLREKGQLVKGNQAHTIIVLQLSGESEFCGAIHYGIQKTAESINELAIHALDVLPHHQNKHYGSLLLSFAIAHARRESCTNVNLKTTDEGNYLYASFGFLPQCNDGIPPGKWDELGYLAKVKILQKCTAEVSRYLTLDLQDKKIQTLIQERLSKALTPSQPNSKNQICLEEIEIPDEAYDWDIFPPEEDDYWSLYE